MMMIWGFMAPGLKSRGGLCVEGILVNERKTYFSRNTLEHTAPEKSKKHRGLLGRTSIVVCSPHYKTNGLKLPV